MKRNCVLCYNRESVTPKTPFCEIPAQIICSCSKYLSYEIVQVVSWTNIFDTGSIFCSQCFESIQKLTELNILLEQTQSEINSLAVQINKQIFHERRNYELNKSATNSFSVSETSGTFSSQHNQTVEHNVNFNVNEASNSNYNQSQFPHANNANYTHNNLSLHKDQQNHNFWSDDNHDSPQTQMDDFPDGNIPLPDLPKKDENTCTKLQRHLQEGVAGFKCQKCNKNFSRMTILQRHDCGKETFDCKTCGLSFSGQGVLNLHTSRSHTGDKPFGCETCGKRFGFKHHLTLHIRTHTGEKPFACDLCEKRFADSSTFAKHKQTHAGSERIKYKCEICGKSYVEMKTLRRHIRVHLGTSKYNCDICGKAFSSTSILRNHQLVHTGEKSHICEQCGRAFARVESLQCHLLTHSDDKPLECDQCGKRVRFLSHLREHKLREHSKPQTIICDICGKTFINLPQYRSHRRGHNLATKECSTCGKKFKQKDKLALHMKTVHEGERPFKCDSCDKTFTLGVSLRRHKETHHSASPSVVCGVCEKHFRASSELKKHQLTSHNVTAGFSVTCATCQRIFLDLGAYEWHLFKLNSIHKLKCRLCKNKDVGFPTFCETFIHHCSQHQGKALPFQCKICNFTMPKKTIKTHKCLKIEKKRQRRHVSRKVKSKSKRKSIVKDSESEESQSDLLEAATIKLEIQDESSSDHQDFKDVQIKTETE